MRKLTLVPNVDVGSTRALGHALGHARIPSHKIESEKYTGSQWSAPHATNNYARVVAAR